MATKKKSGGARKLSKQQKAFGKIQEATYEEAYRLGKQGGKLPAIKALYKAASKKYLK
jgi:hypothetical protein